LKSLSRAALAPNELELESALETVGASGKSKQPYAAPGAPPVRERSRQSNICSAHAGGPIQKLTSADQDRRPGSGGVVE
jgi:hypothetical protein